MEQANGIGRRFDGTARGTEAGGVEKCVGIPRDGWFCGWENVVCVNRIESICARKVHLTPPCGGEDHQTRKYICDEKIQETDGVQPVVPPRSPREVYQATKTSALPSPLE